MKVRITHFQISVTVNVAEVTKRIELILKKEERNTSQV